MAAQEVDAQTGTKCVQSNQADRDDFVIENNPGLFSAEQTWPTEDELKRNRKEKLAEDDAMPAEIDQEPLDLSQIKPAIKKKDEDLSNLFNKMQISVVGRENEQDNNSDFEDMSEGDDEEGDQDLDEDVSGKDDEEHAAANDPDSKKHIKYADLEARA